MKASTYCDGTRPLGIIEDDLDAQFCAIRAGVSDKLLDLAKHREGPDCIY